VTGATAPPSLAAPVPPSVLVVDDEKNIRVTLDMVLSGAGYHVAAVETAEEALTLLSGPRQPVDLVILDLKLPGMSGLDALRQMRQDDATRHLPVIVISGHASTEEAVEAVTLGASDFFEKPLSRERVLVSAENCIRAARLKRTVEHMQSELEQRFEMVGTSAPMQQLFTEIDKVAPTRASVLINGESGTGKELVSRAIHRLGRRGEGPFVKVNCAAIPSELIESELFGHERGAFTGAQGRKRGLFEQAHGGSLFLDEIGDMASATQAKVLRALQSGEIQRVGSEQVLTVDVRVLAATNKDLERAVQEGSFREDLLFRLNVFPIRVPALRQLREDIPLLARRFVETFCADNGLRMKRIDPSLFHALVERPWPGNVRELRNVVERAAILASDVITIADLPEDPHTSPFDDDIDTTPPPVEQPDGRRLTLKEYREASERSYIVQTLTQVDWNISKAAVELGIERTNLHKKIRAYAIRRGEPVK
jgi:DNA-binding NtrC family response regulator